MRLRDLPAERKTDARAFRLRGKERHEKILRVHDARPFIAHVKLDAFRHLTPADRDVAASFERCVDRVVDEVDQQLLHLRRVCVNDHWWADGDPHRQARLKADDALDQLLELKRLLSPYDVNQQRVTNHCMQASYNLVPTRGTAFAIAFGASVSF